MISVLLLVSILIILFITSQKIFSSLFFILVKILRSKKVSTYVLSFFFFPGVVIHELSHAVMAGLLQVRVGEIEFSPILSDDGLKMGSVQIARTDPFRRFLIGVAPIILGSGVLSVALYYFTQWISLTGALFTAQNTLLLICSLYVIFVITNTMFSSRKDMEGVLGLLIFIVIILTILFVAGRGTWIVEGVLYLSENTHIQMIIQKMLMLLLIPLGINVAIVSLFFMLRRKR